MKTKKIIATIAIFGLSLGLAGCSNNDTKPEAKSEPTKIAKPENEERTTEKVFDESEDSGQKTSEEIRQDAVVELKDIKDTEFTPEQVKRYNELLSLNAPPVDHFGISRNHTSEDVNATLDIIKELNEITKTINGTGNLEDSRIIKPGSKAMQVLQQTLPLMNSADGFMMKIAGIYPDNIENKKELSKEDKMRLYALVPSLDENGQLPFETGESDCVVFDKFIGSEYLGGDITNRTSDFGFELFEAGLGRDDIWRCKETGEEYRITIGTITHFQKNKDGKYRVSDMKSIDSSNILKNPLRKRDDVMPEQK